MSYEFHMVDMGGIDIATANRTVVDGLYNKLIEGIDACGNLILYNWKFVGINIAPSACTVLQQANSILINGLIQVTKLDQITVIGLPPPLVPVAPLEVVENGLYEAEPPQSGFNPVTVNVDSGVNLYTNDQIYQSMEQITDVSRFTLLYDASIRYGNNGQKVAARLEITDESAHSTLQAGGWNANGMAYYDEEYLIGAYGGYDFGEVINIKKVKFWLNRYSGQNKTLIATVEYLDGNGNWNEIQDLKIIPNMSYPSYVFDVSINRSVYGIRWIHKKEPKKTPDNNIAFAGMSVYRGLGQSINVYIPDSSGLIMPPTGYDGFGPLYIS